MSPKGPKATRPNGTGNGVTNKKQTNAAVRPAVGTKVKGGKVTKVNGKPTKKVTKKKQISSGGGQVSTSHFYQSLFQQAKQQTPLTNESSAPGMSMRRSLASMTVLEDLHAGIPVVKINRKGDHHRRYLTLSQDQCALFLTHSKVDNETHASRLPKPIWTLSKGLNGDYFRYMDVADILDVQIGVWGTQILEMGIKPTKRETWKDQTVSIFHYERFLGKQHLNLLIENPRHRMALVGALATMKERYDDQSSWIAKETLLLRYWWYEMDTDQSMVVTERDFIVLCDRLQFVVPNLAKEFRFFCKEMGAANGHQLKLKLTYGECVLLLNKLKSNTPDKQAVDAIWKALFKTDTTVDAKRFCKQVLCSVQGEKEATIEDTKALITSLNTMERGDMNFKQSPEQLIQLTKAGFEEYLKSPWNDAFCPIQQKLPTKGLTKPLSAYFINTSHRTYWMGGLGAGANNENPISAEAYSKALLRGAKCLELDVQDGYEQKRGEMIPIIQPIRNDESEQGGEHRPHLGQQEQPVELLWVLHVVNNYLTKYPQTYPIILCIENNCSRPYQDAMASMIKSTFGTRLFIPNDTQRTTELPSPEELKGMVVIQAKRPSEPDIKPAMVEKDRKRLTTNFMTELFDKFDNDGVIEEGNMSTMVPQSFLGLPNGNNGRMGLKKGKSGDLGELESYSPKLLQVTYLHQATFKYLEDSMDLMPSHYHAINESRVSHIASYYDNNPKLWRQYNERHLTRCYPSNERIVDGSNASPILPWAMGCQMVSQNGLTADSGLLLNDGLFLLAGGCGYVEKPPSLFKKKGEVPPTPRPAAAEPKKIKIRILAGNCLPKPRQGRSRELDPKVHISLHDLKLNRRTGKQECTIEKHVTKKVSSNGYCPVFLDSGHGFAVSNPDIAMLVFQVRNAAEPTTVDSDDYMACAAIPIRALRKGFRSVQLRDPHTNQRMGPFLCATLLVHILFSE